MRLERRRVDVKIKIWSYGAQKLREEQGEYDKEGRDK